MSEDSYQFLGFFLGSVPAGDDTELLRMAAMDVTGNNRKVAKLRVSNEEPFTAKIGEFLIIMTTSSELEDNLLCRFQHLQEPLYIHDDVDGGLVHTHKNFEVSEASCTLSGVFRHAELRDMIDEKHLMVRGGYHSMTFQVVPDEETFTLKVLQAVKREGDLIITTETNRFDMIGMVLAAEKDQIIKQENESWTTFGHMKVVKFKYGNVIEGTRPIFELVNKKYEELFQQRINGGPQVIMIKQVQDENGEWQDAPSDGQPELKGCVLSVEECKDFCIVNMTSKIRHLAQFLMKVDEIYRFEVFLTNDDVNFWRQKKHDNHDVFQYTVGDGDPESESTEPSTESPEVPSNDELPDASRCKFMDALEAHLMDGEKLNALADKRSNIRTLNESQRKAVEMARNKERKLVCIQGPPGTGKTFALAHLIASLLKENTPAVVMTPTKEALANIQRITRDVVKNGNVHPDAFLDYWTYLERIDAADRAEKAGEQQKRFSKAVEENRMSKEEYNKLMNTLTAKVKTRVTEELFKNVKVVFSTITSSFVSSLIRSKTFIPELCIIDEAGQVMEAQTWPACCSLQRIVMAGDPNQLGATVFSNEAVRFNLRDSVMYRIMQQKERFSWIMLEKQYRCHPQIIDWSNNTFYDGKVDTVVTINPLKYFFNKVPRNNIARVYDPLVMIDTSMEVGTDLQVKCFEKPVAATTAVNKKKGDFTYANEGEAEIALDHFKNLVDMGVDQMSIAIITPYKGQQELLQKMVGEQNLGTVMIGTVDSYQGQEFNVVIFSMVRSNPSLELGFVTDLRRLNVAVTRARHHFCLIGNAFMLFMKGNKIPEIKTLLEAFTKSDHRFPPCFVRQQFKPFAKNRDITNNFGYNFELFLKASDDESIKQRVHDFLDKADDFKAKRRLNNREKFNQNLQQQPATTNGSSTSDKNAQP